MLQESALGLLLVYILVVKSCESLLVVVYMTRVRSEIDIAIQESIVE